jgi:hypothetical protein
VLKLARKYFCGSIFILIKRLSYLSLAGDEDDSTMYMELGLVGVPFKVL